MPEPEPDQRGATKSGDSAIATGVTICSLARGSRPSRLRASARARAVSVICDQRCGVTSEMPTSSSSCTSSYVLVLVLVHVLVVLVHVFVLVHVHVHVHVLVLRRQDQT